MSKQGYITDIKHDPNGKFGPSWTVFIDGKGMGFMKFAPKGVAVGDFVGYESETNARGYENLKAGTLTKLAAPAGVTPPTRAEPSVIKMDRQDVISRQAALNSALEFITLLVTSDALPAGKSLTAEKKADKIEQLVMEYTQKFHLLSTGAAYEIPEAALEDGAVNWDEQE